MRFVGVAIVVVVAGTAGAACLDAEHEATSAETVIVTMTRRIRASLQRLLPVKGWAATVTG
ncbi:MAG: hypothetical protein M3Q30_13290, partial [Actinomycetota bacterium]|nr:hypothetical protein [Actinomycetota bacterium]